MLNKRGRRRRNTESPSSAPASCDETPDRFDIADLHCTAFDRPWQTETSQRRRHPNARKVAGFSHVRPRDFVKPEISCSLTGAWAQQLIKGRNCSTIACCIKVGVSTAIT